MMYVNIQIPYGNPVASKGYDWNGKRYLKLFLSNQKFFRVLRRQNYYTVYLWKFQLWHWHYRQIRKEGMVRSAEA